ncbi:MAG: tyrosine/phenylalanine carboxypeptidase domain-containing protein [Patescibacteria group bacterium]|jgi:hypothetical protein
MEHLDALLFQTLNTLPSFPFARLVRPDRKSAQAAKAAFFENRTLPQLSYSVANNFDCAQYLRSLDTVASTIESLKALNTVHLLYKEKINELKTRCTLIQAIQRRDDIAVSHIADELFGTPKQTASKLEAEYTDLVSRSEELHAHEDRINAKLFSKMVHATLEHYGIKNWTVRETTRPSISIVHGNATRMPTIKIPKNFIASKARVARVLTHEIEVHALRSHNGRTSPLLLLGRGLANSITTEEGLAIALQQTLRSEASTDPGFWDAWTAALTIDYGFEETFEIIYTARQNLNIALGRENPEKEARNTAWRLLIRAYRGIHSPKNPGFGYRRDHIYRSGLIKIREAFNTYGKENILPTLFAGHISIQHIPVLQTLGITGRIPEMIGAQIVKKVLRAEQKTRVN